MKRLIKVLTNGIYQLAEKEFATVSGQKHTSTAPVWKKNKDITSPSYKLKVDKTTGVMRVLDTTRNFKTRV